jgi:catechol 2,3-dioxygenase
MLAAGEEPMFDVAQLAHIELVTPTPDRTLWFFKDLLGLQETERRGQSAFLRAYEDLYHHSLQVTEGPQAGLGHVSWRASSQAALERRVAAIRARGMGLGWSEGDPGQGAAFRFRTPEDHPMEILWEVEHFKAVEDERSALKNRVQRRPLSGVPVRRIDHVNLLAAEVGPVKNFMMETLGFRLREAIVLRDGREAGVWMSVSPLVHEIAVMGDQSGERGRFHHVCYWYGYPQHLADIADVFQERGIEMEAGPGKHGISQAQFLYVWEPGGNRVELFGDAGYLIFAPDWQPIVWTEDELDKGIIWYGSPLPAEFFLRGTPSHPRDLGVGKR